MILFILYCIIGTLIGGLFHRVSKFKDKEVPKAVPACLIGATWPFTAPCWLALVLMNKVLDKFTKV